LADNHFQEKEMESESSAQPVLIGQSGPLNGQRWALNDTLLIGRDPECQIVVPDRQVSRFHARISHAKDGVLIEDLGSKNGTSLNNTIISDPIYLQDGDFIHIALVQQFVYLSSDSTLPMDSSSMTGRETRSKLFIDHRSRRVWIGKTEIVPPLSVPQFKLLELLYEQPQKVVSRQDLVLVVWGEEEAIGVSEQALDALIRRLRDRLSEIDPEHTYINTIRGHGVRLDNPQE
jgi:pSer/pThr/pTyr-binding forkhead associated (FHA) protein